MDFDKIVQEALKDPNVQSIEVTKDSVKIIKKSTQQYTPFPVYPQQVDPYPHWLNPNDWPPGTVVCGALPSTYISGNEESNELTTYTAH